MLYCIGKEYILNLQSTGHRYSMYHLNQTGVILQYMLYYYLSNVKFMEGWPPASTETQRRNRHFSQKVAEAKNTHVDAKYWRNLGLLYHPTCRLCNTKILICCTEQQGLVWFFVDDCIAVLIIDVVNIIII